MLPYSSAEEGAGGHSSLFSMQKEGEKTLKSQFSQPFSLSVKCKGLKRTKKWELQE